MATPPPKPVPGRFNLTLPQAAWLADLSTVRFHQCVRPLIPEDAVHRKGQKVMVDGRAAMRAVVAYRAGQSAPAGPSGDPLLEGGGSPALEQYRKARAELATMELEEWRGSHVPLRRLSAVLVKFGGLLHRTVGEPLLRRFGNDAAELFNAGVDEAAASLVKDLERATAAATTD